MILGFDEFELDPANLELRREGEIIKADALVLRLLIALARNPDRLVTKDELVELVWEGRAVADNVITVSMARLRKTLGHRRGDREFVATVYGRGYRFVRKVSARARTPSASPRLESAGDASAPFVGRERVLSRLRQAMGDARAGRGRLCALMGEPGIGKTRLIETLERELQGEQVRIAWGYGRESGDTPPLWPWLRMLREVMAAVPTQELEQRLGSLAQEIHGLLDGQRGATQEAALGPQLLDWERARRHRGFEALLRTFALAAEHSPWLLVLDDLHGADAASIELLSLLLDEISHTRILVIASLRHAPGRQAPRPETLLPHVLGHRNCERMTLERLSAKDVASYVAAMVDDSDGTLGRAVFAKSDGNPFFMVELSRQLREAERPSADELALPGTALELVRQRLERLDADTLALLSAAAVIGRSFELPLLSAITGREPAAMMASLDDALAAEVVVAAPDSMTAFGFGHELLRSVLYDALAPSEQRRWHLTIAQALEARSATGDTTPPAEIAYHYYGALPQSDLRKTVEYCRRAAAAAGAVFANPDVVRYTRHALEALDLMDNPSVRLRGALLYTMVLFGRGHGVEFPRAIGKVLRLAYEQGDARLLVDAASMLNPHTGFKPVPGGNAAFSHALSLLASDDKRTRAVALSGLACLAPQCYAAQRTHELITEALALARASGSRSALHMTLACQLYLEGGPAHAAAASRIEEELSELARKNPRVLPVLPVVLNIQRARSALQRGDGAGMTLAIEHATARCRELRHRELLWHCERFSALARINAGAWSSGVALLETLHRRAEQLPILGSEPFCAFDRVVIFGELAETASLDERTRGALEYDPTEPPSVWALKLRALASVGLNAEAHATLRAVDAADLAQLPCDTDYIGTLGHLARAALALQARDYAEAIYPLLARYPDHFAGQVSFLCDGSVVQLLGMLAESLGRHAEALCHFEAGITANERAGFEPRAAEARLQLAQCLVAHGEHTSRARERAQGLAREAHASATRMGMPRLAQAAAEWLAKTERL